MKLLIGEVQLNFWDIGSIRKSEVLSEYCSTHIGYTNSRIIPDVGDEVSLKDKNYKVVNVVVKYVSTESTDINIYLEEV